jgi:hypothetical protein
MDYFTRKKMVDFSGTRNDSNPNNPQLMGYTCMVSLLGVATNDLNKYLFYDDGDVRQDVVELIVRPFLRIFDRHMLSPLSFNSVAETEYGDDYELWDDCWEVGTLNEPHLLTATFVMIQ